LFIKGEYGQNTARLYRNIQKHSTLSPESVEFLKSAVQLSSLQEQQAKPRGRGRGGSSWGRGVPFNRDNRDPYSRFASRNVPPKGSDQHFGSYHDDEQ
jgi:hypothetical protein